MSTETSETPEATETMFFNGIDGSTGKYSMEPLTTQQFSDLLSGMEQDEDQDWLRSWATQYLGTDHYGVKEGIDPKKLEEAGWGIVFAHDADPAVIDALRPLMEWRKAQAGEYYKEYSGGTGGVRPKDSKSTWLARQGGSVGPADPEKVPYYLMIVGSPERIPYRFQTLLDVQYAVGRIHFDTAEEYARYAQSVVLAEKQQIRLPRKMTFWGVSNPDDPATRMSSEHLVGPLMEMLSKNKQEKPWQFDALVQAQANKDCLHSILNGRDLPGLLFTASHGMGFPKQDPKQIRHQGALLCQDWPGPRRHQGTIPEKFYFSGDDLSADANLLGMIAFFFACYGAGTPLQDEFAQQAFKNKRVDIAERPFIASLPKKMLSLEKGGALAVVGHVERAWGHSFFWGKNRSLGAFESAMLALMDGYPVGYAFEYFNERYAEISTELTDLLGEMEFDLQVDPIEIAGKWTATNDSKNYVVLGDPAVRMMVAEDGGAVPERPSIEVVSKAEQPVAAKTVDEPLTEVAAAQPDKEAEVKPAVVEGVEFGAPAVFAGGGAAASGAGQPAPGGSLAEMVKKLAGFIGQAVDNAATLEVRTYTSQEMVSVTVGNGEPSGASLRAMTVISILGDVTQVVPVQDGEVDQALWNIHMETVKQAQASRNEVIKSALAAAASLSHIRIDR